MLPITRTCIDSGGHRSTECYIFCKPRENRGVFAIKGKGGVGIHIVHGITKTKKVKNNLFIIAVDVAKAKLFSWLAFTDEKKTGYCHFPHDEDDYQRNYDDKYFNGLTSEIKTIKLIKGRPKTEWKLKKGARNEPLDCRVYNIAAIEILNPNFFDLKRQKGNKPVKRKRRKGTVSEGVRID